MRLTRIYIPNPKIQNPLQVEADAARHLIQVLRYQVGDYFTAFDGQGNEFEAQILTVSKKSLTVTLTAKATQSVESKFAIHLAQSLVKRDKMDYIIQKAVELGVTQITPIITQHTDIQLNIEQQLKKHQHWQQIIISACEQCGRSWLPTLNTITEFQTFIHKGHTSTLLLHPHAALSLSSWGLSSTTVTILIGPEGGFSEAEVLLAQQYGIPSLRLGPRVLRTETASIAAIAALQVSCGDF